MLVEIFAMFNLNICDIVKEGKYQMCLALRTIVCSGVIIFLHWCSKPHGQFDDLFTNLSEIN